MNDKKLEWKYRKASDTYDLYFSPYGDDPELIASVCFDINGDWIFSSKLLNAECDYLDCYNLEGAKNQILISIERHYADEISYYQSLLKMVNEEINSEMNLNEPEGELFDPMGFLTRR